MVYLCNLEKAGFTSAEEKIDCENNCLFFKKLQVGHLKPVKFHVQNEKKKKSVKFDEFIG